MADFPASGPGVVLSDHVVLRAAVAAYLGATAGRPGCTPTPTYGIFLRWCADHDLDPLTAARVGHRAVRPLAAAPPGARDPCSGTHGCRDGDLGGPLRPHVRLHSPAERARRVGSKACGTGTATVGKRRAATTGYRRGIQGGAPGDLRR